MDMDNELEELQEILQADPYNFQARRTLSLALLDNGFNKEAKKNLLYLVRTFPENAELHYNLGIACEKLAEYENAERAYQKAIEISPETDFYYNLGLTYIEMKDYPKAIATLKHVIDAEPNDANTYFNIGLCFYNTNEYEVAIDYFKKAIELNFEDVFSHFYLANILKHFGQYDMAIQEYQTVTQLVPDYSWAYFNLGSIAYEVGETEAALQYLQQTLKYNPKDTEAIKIMVQIYIKQERYQEAITALCAGLEAAENGDLYYILARVFKLVNDEENYFSALSKALEHKLTLTFDIKKIDKVYQQLLAQRPVVEEPVSQEPAPQDSTLQEPQEPQQAQ